MNLPPNANVATEICQWCKGSGKDRDQEYCNACGGVGSVVIVQPSRKCANCSGTGIDQNSTLDSCRCALCHGAGWAHKV